MSWREIPVINLGEYMSRVYSKKVWSWALYDWGNSAFATVVMAGFFPIVFKQYWAHDLESHHSTFFLGLSNSISSGVIVLIAPLIGAIADQGGKRKQFLMVFALLGILATACLTFVQMGYWQLAMVFYILAMIGFMGGNIFYDAMLLSVSPSKDYDRVSSLGYALGYIGGALILTICVAMSMQPAWFGFADVSTAANFSFFLTAVWWAVFSIPLVKFVPQEKKQATHFVMLAKQGFSRLIHTFSQLRANRAIILFLLAYWFYIDGVHTIIVMAVDYGLSLGFTSANLITALLLTQIIGFPATLLFGRIAVAIGSRNGIYICLLAYTAITAWGYFMDEVWEFYIIAAVVGLFQGGTQALSRSFYARLIPKSDAAEYFGFYNMLGKFAAILGPVLMGTVSLFSGSARISILSVSIFFIIGMVLLSRVNLQSYEYRV